MDFAKKLLDSTRGVYLFGATPPRQSTSPEKVNEIAAKLANRLSPLALDAINLYDIQPETSRSDEPRPFPFLPTMSPSSYSQVLQKLIDTDFIHYKCVVHQPEDEFADWLSESRSALQHLVLVGGASSQQDYSGPTLRQAAEMAAQDFTLGGVTIAERHLAKGNEHLRLIQKASWGLSFFTSQVVYQPQATIQLLQDYYQACEVQQREPVRIVLTFAPCGYEKTLTFLRWLGVDISADTEKTLLSAPSPVKKSVEVCCDSLQQILAACHHLDLRLGINVESVSIKKDEIDASVELFQLLRAILEGFYRDKSS
ncbi:MAG: hypothetical protein F6J97_01985 [Leptolyngbya sp. SIO4C1]|nr:hypothetical protein [Leptolyngbya sp. SIO4C1]